MLALPAIAQSRMPNLRVADLVTQAHSVINAAIAKYKLEAFYTLVSGGNDSMALALVTQWHPRFAGIFHIDTMTGITDTDSWRFGQPESIATRFVLDQANAHKWDVILKQPATRYEQLVLAHGFPGPQQHSHMYRLLKERALNQARIEANAKLGHKRYALVAGVRTSESNRRMGTVEVSSKQGGAYWVSAIHNWTKTDCNQIIEAFKQERNPVSISMGMSGECGCGAYATPEENRVIDALYPQHGARIDRWEEMVSANADIMGVDRQYCRWGHAKGKKIADGQMELEGFQLCTTCIGSQANRALSMHKKSLEVVAS